MRKIFLMSSVLFVAPFVFGESGEVSAQCVATTDCASLGYTEASCPNGGIKCPFGNTWNCKGDGTTAKANCEVGWILYSDKTCSKYPIDKKNPLGIVVYTDNNGHGQILVKERIRNSWADFYQVSSDGLNYHNANLTDIPALKNYTKTDAATDFDSCGNTQKIIDFAKTNSDTLYGKYTLKQFYPVAGYAQEKGFCIPAAGILNNIKNNLTQVNIGLLYIGADTIGYHSTQTSDFFYSSSEASDTSVWALDFSYYGNSAGNISDAPKFTGSSATYGIFVSEF